MEQSKPLLLLLLLLPWLMARSDGCGSFAVRVLPVDQTDRRLSATQAG